MPSTRETVGKIYTQLKAKQQDRPDIHEFIKVTQADYIPSLVALVDKCKQKAIDDFYVEVCIKRNIFLAPPDDIERYMKARHTCPTPFYDRHVFRYDKKNDRIQFLWAVPSPEECDYYINNLLLLRPDEKEAAQNVLDFKDGTLLKLAKTLNKETNDYELIFYRKDENGKPIASGTGVSSWNPARK